MLSNRTMCHSLKKVTDDSNRYLPAVGVAIQFSTASVPDTPISLIETIHEMKDPSKIYNVILFEAKHTQRLIHGQNLRSVKG